MLPSKLVRLTLRRDAAGGRRRVSGLSCSCELPSRTENTATCSKLGWRGKAAGGSPVCAMRPALGLLRLSLAAIRRGCRQASCQRAILERERLPPEGALLELNGQSWCRSSLAGTVSGWQGMCGHACAHPRVRQAWWLSRGEQEVLHLCPLMHARRACPASKLSHGLLACSQELGSCALRLPAPC